MDFFFNFRDNGIKKASNTDTRLCVLVAKSCLTLCDPMNYIPESLIIQTNAFESSILMSENTKEIYYNIFSYLWDFV